MRKIENVIFQKKLDTSITEQAILYKGELFTYFDMGLTRYVFVNDDKTKVIKILIEQSRHGHDFNQEELDIYNNAKPEKQKQLAKTEMNGRIIEQEFCNPIKFDKRPMTIPQMRFASSCRNEVGWNKEGVLVCFDLDEYRKY